MLLNDSVVRPNADPGQIAMAATRQAMSDSGSGLGAATCWQVRSDTVTVPVSPSLSCRNVVGQRLCRRARLVRKRRAAG